VIVARVVIVAVGTRQAIVPVWSSTIEPRLFCPLVIHIWLHVGEYWPVQCHDKYASPLGTSEGIVNSATW
jgi:hypothetical protein